MHQAHPRHLLGIFILSVAMLAFQLALTRIFSVVLLYHFAFAGISLAMLGLTFGASRVFRMGIQSATAQQADTLWARSALGFGISSVTLTLAFLGLPAFFSEQSSAQIAAFGTLFLFIIPFTFGGTCIALLLTGGYRETGRLYAADLVGSAIGCIAVVIALFHVDPITVVFAVGALSALSAAIVVSGNRKGSLLAKTLMAALLLCSLIQGTLYHQDLPRLRIIWSKEGLENNILFERWNAYSRLKILSYGSQKPYGRGGYAIEPDAQVNQLFMNMDPDSHAVVTQFDGDISKLSFLKSDVINIAYYVRPVAETLVVGIGGGRDILTALAFGVRKVTGIEMNNSTFEALTQNFASFTGNLMHRRDVEFIKAEARSWVNEHDRKFDLVHIPMVDSWTSTASGGLALVENRLYTVEAWSEFMNTLTPHGMLTVTRWNDPLPFKTEFYRLLSLAVETLKKRGVSEKNLQEHILAYATPRVVTIVISPVAFTPQEITRANEAAAAQKFSIFAAGSYATDDVALTILSGKADDDYMSQLHKDISAPTDNNPFFFYTKPASRFIASLGLSSNPLAEVSQSIRVLYGMLVATFIFLITYFASCMLRHRKTIQPKQMLPHMFYFFFIGAGFMLVEISQLQRLMVLLGHPIYGLSVVLVILMLFGGIGSATVSDTQSPRQIRVRALMLCLLLLLTGLATEPMTEIVKHYGIFWRITASIALLAPVACFMGMMFPLGMAFSRNIAKLQPSLWGINGAASVFASVLATFIALEQGISATYWCGALCYGICAAMAWSSKPGHDAIRNE